MITFTGMSSVILHDRAGRHEGPDQGVHEDSAGGASCRADCPAHHDAASACGAAHKGTLHLPTHASGPPRLLMCDKVDDMILSSLRTKKPVMLVKCSRAFQFDVIMSNTLLPAHQ